MTPNDPSSPPLLELDAVVKRYPGATALDRVSFALRPGEVHALVGENGAGKSTIVNLLCGVIRPDEGEIRLDGRPIRLLDPVHARGLGVVVVHQEVDVFDPLSIAESTAISGGLPSRLGFVRRRAMRREAAEAVATLPEPVDVRSPAGSLGVARRQMIAVASAVAKRGRVVLLDEPTSSLSNVESEWLFDQVARLKAQGVGILYISHRPEEIARLADRATVLRDGRVVWTGATADADRTTLIRLMVGRETPPVERSRSALDRTKPALRATNADATLDVARGEILGVYGLVGSGRSEFARAVYGLRRGAVAGMEVEVEGMPVRIGSPQDAVRAGIAYLPEDRLRQAIFPTLSLRANLVVSSLERWGVGPIVFAASERAGAAEPMRATGVRARSLEQPIRELSGGNQQKIVVGRALLARPKVLILDEPTRGVDLGAKAEIHRLVRKLADDGAGVMLISSDLPEVLSQADRVAVFRQGRVVSVFEQGPFDAEAVASAALPEGNAGASAASTRKAGRARGEAGLLLAVVALGLVLAVTTGGRFATSSNLIGLFGNASVVTILALGSATVMIAGGIDISVGSLLGLSAACAGLLLRGGEAEPWRTPLGIAVGLLVGTCGGLLNASLALVGRIHPVIATLGMMTVYRGVLLVLTGGDVIGGLPDAFRSAANGASFGVPGSIVVLGAACLLASLHLSATVSGRKIHAFGANPRAARLAGISKAATWRVAFGIGGLSAGLAGLLELAQNGSMQSMMGQGYELKAITAAVVGGVAVSGGRGTVRGVLLGGLLLSLVQNALVLWSVSRHHYDLVIGGLLLAAIVVDRWSRSARS